MFNVRQAVAAAPLPSPTPKGRRPRLAPVLTAALLLLSALLPAAAGHAATSTGSHPSVHVVGWYPAERMCEMDVPDDAQGWACLRSSDRSGWELQIRR
jgi:hypothetical protein